MTMLNVEPRETFIYLMKSRVRGDFKIGRSGNPTKRIKTLRRYIPDIEVVDTVKAHPVWESDLHAKFSSLRIYGEWFALGPKEIAVIRELFERKREFDVQRESR